MRPSTAPYAATPEPRADRSDSPRERYRRYRRAVDFIAAAQIYLRDNPLLQEPLRPEHIKDRLLGHWGTAPGINTVYAHLNRLVEERDANLMLVTGPGHGAAANMANLWLEGTLAEFYPRLSRDEAGLRELFREFSWPYGFPSHLSPSIPAVIHEGGELGYALATSFGAVLDSPGLVVACIVSAGGGCPQTSPATANAARPSTLIAASVFWTTRPGPRPTAWTRLKRAMIDIAARFCGEIVSDSVHSDSENHGVASPSTGTAVPRKPARPTAAAAMAPEKPATNDVQPVRKATTGPNASRR